MARVTTTTNKAAKKAKGHAPLRLQEVLRRLRIRELLQSNPNFRTVMTKTPTSLTHQMRTATKTIRDRRKRKTTRMRIKLVLQRLNQGISPTLFPLLRSISVSSWDRYRFNQYIFLTDFCSISSFSPISVSDIGSSNFNIGVVIINIGWPISVNFSNLYRS